MAFFDDRVVAWALIVVLAIFVTVAYHFARKAGGASANTAGNLKVALNVVWILLAFTTVYWGYYVLNKTGATMIPGIPFLARAVEGAKVSAAMITPRIPLVSAGKHSKKYY